MEATIETPGATSEVLMLGRLVSEYLEYRRKFEGLLQEAGRFAERLDQLRDWANGDWGNASALEGFPETAEIRRFVEHMAATFNRYQELRQTLNDVGFPRL